MSLSDYTIRRLARVRSKYMKAAPAMSGAYIDLLSVYTDLVGAVQEQHLKGKPISPETVMALHTRAMASVEAFRNGAELIRQADEGEE